VVGKLGSYGGIDPAVLPGDLAEKWSRVRDGNDALFRKSLGLVAKEPYGSVRRWLVGSQCRRKSLYQGRSV
jgi:hypothetical protein